MCEWKECKIKDVARRIISGGTPSTKIKEYYGGEIPWLNTKEIGFNRITNTEGKITEDGLSNSSAKWIEQNSVVVAMYGATAGKIAINKIPLTTNQACCNLTIDENIADYNFVYYYLYDSYAELENLASGAAQQNLNVGIISDFPISLPPLPEQRAIASVLSSLDDKIYLLHRQNKTLEAMAETLFRQWFVEEAEEGGEGKLGDYINVKHGYAFKGKFITTGKNNQILVTPGNFKIGGGFKVGKMKYFIGSDYPKDYIFSSDDLIVTMTDLSNEGDTLGYSALIPEHNQDEVLYLHNQRVGKVEFKKDVSKYFFYYLMKTDDYQWFILGGASGTSIRHTSPTSICSYPFKVPPMKRIEEFDAVVSELISKVYKNQNQIRTLEKLRRTLLPKLISGQIRINNLENFDVVIN
jgi:type I restriction enzyme S subunit